MSCVEPRMLADLSSGRLDGRQRANAQNHIATCASCRAVSTRMKRVSDTLLAIAEMPPPPLSSASSARFEATLRWTRVPAEADVTPRFRPWTLRFAGGLMAAAALFFVIAGSARMWRQRHAPTSETPVEIAKSKGTEPRGLVPAPAPPAIAVESLRAVVTLVGGDARLQHGGAPSAASAPIDLAVSLAPRDRLLTAHEARLAFQWGEGSGALLDGGSELLLSRLEARAQELTLLGGQVSVRVGPHQPGESLRVVSPDHTVTVHGTWFVVAADARGTGVEVLEGVVEVASRSGDGASTRLTAPSRAFFPREHGVAEGERALTGREAAARRLASEMGLLAWAGPDQVLGATGILKLGSEPAGELVVDGVAFGETPLQLRRPRGDRHLVEISRFGYTTLRRWVSIGEGNEELHMALPHVIGKSLAPPAATEEVRQMVGTRRGQIAACYSHSLKRDPSLSGTVTLQLRIGSAGQVMATTVKADTVHDQQVLDCLRHEAASWTFERARNATVEYPFVFRAPSAP